MGKWSLDIKGWNGKQEEKVAAVKKEFAFQIYTKIVERTPVAEDYGGRARGNWIPSVGRIDTSVDMSKTEPRVKSVSQMPDAPGDESYFISNNLPYITTLEYGGYPNPPKRGSWDKKHKRYVIKSRNGFSKQAPKGMVGVTVAEAERYLRQAVNAQE